MTDFAAALYEARRWRHLSRAELGHRVGVSGETVRRWEVGDFLPRSPDVAYKIDLALGTDFEAQLFGSIRVPDAVVAPSVDDMSTVLEELRRMRDDIDELRSALGGQRPRRGGGPSRQGSRPSVTMSTAHPPLPGTPHAAAAS